MPTQVTDPALLAQLNGSPAPAQNYTDQQGVAHVTVGGPQEVTDPALLAQLNAPAAPQPSFLQQAGDDLSAGFTSGVNALPIVGPTVLGGLEQAKALVQGRPVADVQATDAAQDEANPVASMAGTVAGTALPFLAVGPETLAGKALGMSGPLVGRVLAGGLSGGVIGGADAVARGKSLQDAGTDALVDAGVGAGLPVLGAVVKGVAGALRGPAALAPAAASLKAEAGAAYDAARANSNGAEFQPRTFNPLHSDLTAVANDAGAVLPSGKVAPGFAKVKGALAAAKQFGASSAPVTIQQQAILRKIIGNVASSTDRTEAMIGSKMIDAFDNYFDNLPDSAFVGKNAAGPAAMASIAKARQAYATAMRTQAFEQVVARAKRAGGTDAAYRSAFASFLNSSRRTRGFPPAQLAAIEQFVKGGPIGNLVKSLSNMMPGVNAAAPVLKAAAGRAAAGKVEALRAATAGVTPPSAMDQWLQRLTDANDKPVNLGVIPQSAGLLTSRGGL